MESKLFIRLEIFHDKLKICFLKTESHAAVDLLYLRMNQS